MGFASLPRGGNGNCLGVFVDGVGHEKLVRLATHVFLVMLLKAQHTVS